jgi:hypothetical protein
MKDCFKKIIQIQHTQHKLIILISRIIMLKLEEDYQ